MIDCHFHIWAEDNSTPEKRARVADRLRREIEAVDVEKVCLIGPIPSSLEEARESNRIVAQYVEEHPDVFYGWAQTDPREGKEAVEEFRRAVEEDGLVGLKHHFWGSPVKCSDPAFFPLAEAAVEMDVPILEHVLHRVGPYVEEHDAESYTEDVAALAERYPELKFLSAHIAGGGDWEYRLKNIAPYENVYLDLSGSIREAGIYEMAVDYLGTDRLVWGSDNVLLSCVGKLASADLTPEQKADVAYGFEELLGDHVETRLSDDDRAARRERLRERFASAGPRGERIVVANGFLGEYSQRAHDGSAEALLSVMDDRGVDRTLVSAVEATSYRNVQPANERLAERVAGRAERLTPVATVNPSYPAWRDDLDRCVDDLGMAAVKLLPAYHDYAVDDPEVAALLDRCAERDVPVIFSAVLEDQRSRHPRTTLREFRDVGRKKWWSENQRAELVSVLHESPDADVIVADAGPEVDSLCGRLTAETMAGIHISNRTRTGETLFVLGDTHIFYPSRATELAESVGPERLVVGPKVPFKYFDASYVTLDQLDWEESDADAVRAGNVERLLE